MKEKLTLRNILIVGGFTLALATFIMSFFARFTVDMDGTRASYLGIVWGCKYITAPGYDKIPVSEDAGVDRLQPSAILLVGTILIFVGALGAALVALFVNKPFAKWIIVGCAVLVLAGAIMEFFAKSSFVRAMFETMGKAGNWSKEKVDERYNEAMANISKFNPATGVSTASGILAIFAALAIGVAPFLPEKKLVK